MSGCSSCDVPGVGCPETGTRRYDLRESLMMEPGTVSAGATASLNISIYDPNESDPAINFSVTVRVPDGVTLRGEGQWEGVGVHRAQLTKHFRIDTEQAGEFRIEVDFDMGNPDPLSYTRNVALRVNDS